MLKDESILRAIDLAIKAWIAGVLTKIAIILNGMVAQ